MVWALFWRGHDKHLRTTLTLNCINKEGRHAHNINKTNDRIDKARKGGTLIWKGRTYLSRRRLISTRLGRMLISTISTRNGWTCVSIRQAMYARSCRWGREVRSYERDGRLYWRGRDWGSYQRWNDGGSINEELTTLISTISTRNGFDEEWSVEEGTHAQSHLYDKEGRYAVRSYLVWTRFTLVSRQGFTIHVVHWLIMSRKLK